jgi:signal transduction histidine kinase
LFVVASRAAPAEDLPVLRTVQEVRALTKEEAARGYPVHVQGVITFSGRDRWLHFVADSTGGIYLQRNGPNIPRGTRVTIRGRSGGGLTVPIIETSDPTSSVVEQGEGEMPKPLHPEPHQLREIGYDAQLVKVDGKVESVTPDGDGASITLAAVGSMIKIVLSELGGRSTLPAYLHGFRVSATGVLAPAPPAGEPQFLYVGSLRDVEVDPQELEERFASAKLLDSRAWSPPAVTEPVRWYRASGQVIYAQPRVGFFLSFGPNVPSIWVYSAHAADFKFGQPVEVVGRLDSTFHPRMRDAAARPLPSVHNQMPAPDRPPNDNPLDDWFTYHGKLISVDLPVLSIQDGLPGEQNLIFQGRQGLILGRVKQDLGESWRPVVGSVLRVTGVCVLKGSEELGLNADAFWAQLLIRGRGDIEVLKKPPFWTDLRLRWLVWSVLGVSVFAFAWIATLRRRVHSQLAVIGSQLERQVIHEERARVAREWHDTLQQQLVGVSIQVQAAAAQCEQAPKLATQMLERADAMLRHSQAEARRSVWNLRNEILEQRGLAEALKELRLSEPGGRTVNVRSSGDSSRRLPAETEFHLLRIAQEAVANALQHAAAQTIELLLQVDAETVTLSIKDDGCGFDPATAAAADGTHFGLLGMKERAAKIGAQLVIDTAAGRGTKTIVTVKIHSSPRPADLVRS